MGEEREGEIANLVVHNLVCTTYVMPSRRKNALREVIHLSIFMHFII